jgi:hypothetical protein
VGLGNLAYLTWFRNGPAAAMDIAREIQTMARARGFSVTEMWGKAAEIESCFDLGEWDRVLQLAGELVVWDAAHGPSQIGMWGRFAQAWVHVRRGEVDVARAALAEVERSPDLLGFAEFQATAAAIGAVLAQEDGDDAEVLFRVRAFVEATGDIPEVRIHLLPVVVRAAVAAGHVDAAAELVPEGAAPPVERRRLSYDTACAVIAEAQGQADVAGSAYAALAEDWDAFGFPLEAGQCRLGQARCLRSVGRDREARPLLEDARTLLTPLGAAPLLAEIEGLLQRPAYAADSIDAS